MTNGNTRITHGLHPMKPHITYGTYEPHIHLMKHRAYITCEPHIHPMKAHRTYGTYEPRIHPMKTHRTYGTYEPHIHRSNETPYDLRNIWTTLVYTRWKNIKPMEHMNHTYTQWNHIGPTEHMNHTYTQWNHIWKYGFRLEHATPELKPILHA